MWAFPAFLLALPVVWGAQAPTFKSPSVAPLIKSDDFGGPSNTTLSKPTVVKGKAFDRFIQIWMENTDFNVANSSDTFRKLAQQGILLESYYALTHPSEPNYVGVVGGDFWGMHDDNFYHIPNNISTVVDLLEDKNISWASYQESMPSPGFQDFNASLPDYHDSNITTPYFYYVRKHNPLIIYDSVANVTARANRQRTFNDFAADVNKSVIPQWVFITPNMVDDAHDTDIDYGSKWLDFWLTPLLNDTRFNDDRTLILLTFDENESFSENNNVFSVLLGGAVPEAMKGTVDSTFYTHYSSLSTVQANWGLGSLGRQDTNKTVSNVFQFVATLTGYQNVQVTGDAIPLTNLTGTTPGPLNGDAFVPFTAPNMSAVGAGGGPVFVADNLDKSFTPDKAPKPVNLTAINQTVPAMVATPTPTGPANNGSGSGGSGSGGNAADAMVANLRLAVGVSLIAIIGGLITLA